MLRRRNHSEGYGIRTSALAHMEEEPSLAGSFPEAGTVGSTTYATYYMEPRKHSPCEELSSRGTESFAQADRLQPAYRTAQSMALAPV